MKSKRDLIEKILIKRDIESKDWSAWTTVRGVIEEITGNLYSFDSVPFCGIFNSFKEENRSIIEKYYDYIEKDIIQKYDLQPLESTYNSFRYLGKGKEFKFAKLYFGEDLVILLNNSSILDKTHSFIYFTTIFHTSTSIEIAKEIYNKYSEFITKLENDVITESNDLFVKLLISERNGLEWRYLTIPKKTDIDLINYSKEFNKIVPEKMDEFIKSDSGGLVIFRGEPGTGKSSYCKHLITKYKDTANFLIVPQDIILSNPESFRLFLIDSLPCVTKYDPSDLDPNYFDDSECGVSDNNSQINRYNMKTVIIIEDCEKLLVDRDSLQGNNTSIILSDILNYSDGIIGDLVQCKFIFTFNTNLSKIDKAILRKGRMKLNYEFKKLQGEDLQAIMDKLEKTVTEKQLREGMTLAEIYNEEDDDYITTSKKEKIGF
jgi:hypothetical protein